MPSAACDSESRSVVPNSLQPHGLYSPWNSPGQKTGVRSHSLLQGILATQVSNPGLPHCRRILYQLSHKGNPRILERVTYPFSGVSSRSKNHTRISRIAGGFLFLGSWLLPCITPPSCFCSHTSYCSLQCPASLLRGPV